MYFICDLYLLAIKAGNNDLSCLEGERVNRVVDKLVQLGAGQTVDRVCGRKTADQISLTKGDSTANTLVKQVSLESYLTNLMLPLY